MSNESLISEILPRIFEVKESELLEPLQDPLSPCITNSKAYRICLYFKENET